MKVQTYSSSEIDTILAASQHSVGWGGVNEFRLALFLEGIQKGDLRCLTEGGHRTLAGKLYELTGNTPSLPDYVKNEYSGDERGRAETDLIRFLRERGSRITA